jgi:glycosyltransferase involved in cell wall biosynthesis
VAPGRNVVVAVPGLAGGVDEAARHLFDDPVLRRNWSIRVLTTKGRRSWAAPAVFATALATLVVLRVRGRVDLLHLNVSKRGSTLRKCMVGGVARLLGIPYVVQLHSGGFADFLRDLPAWAHRPVRGLFGGARHVFVLGLPFQELVEEALGVPGEKVSILRNGVALPPAPAARIDRRPVILFTGRMGQGKGTFDLLEALGRIADLDWSAVLVGDGEIERVLARAEALGLADRLTIRGWQSRTVIDELLASSDVFVLPSYVEALSVSLLEAMAAGLCCIGTLVGAHGEVLFPEENGLVVIPGDVEGLAAALARVLTDDDLRARLGARARQTIADSCSTGVVSAELDGWYERVLAPV